MSYQKNHIYFVPGMAAGAEIFKNLTFPDNYETHVLEWLIPEKEESLANYAKRMASRIKEPDAILIGVSFGGVVVQEMCNFYNPKKIVIISSVKTSKELPRRMKLASLTKAYKLIPTSLVLSVDDLTKLSVGPKSKKRLTLYQEYLHVRDKRYLDWALEKMITWNNTEAREGIIHIHGEKDHVFPIKYINGSIIIKGGTHIMILNKARKISKILFDLIEE
ncbi:alpha/beta hydrolase [Aequorivita sediminis]|uniref:alpha/beta hydrolase n=1 Tax=Aequorivita sediminis TaxID=3073653 RepID=UPI0028B1CF9B|nr:alpha/beta hydrolase [Aequorivita sp. F6058]